MPSAVVERHVVARDAKQRQTDHQHAGNGAGFERDVQAAGQALRLGGFGGAHVGADGDVHADVAGQTGQDGTDEVADGHGHAELQAKQNADHGADDGDGRVLAVQVGGRTFLNGGGDFLHTCVAGRRRQDGADGIGAVQ